MKKILAMALVLMLALSFFACSPKAADTEAPAAEATEATDAAAETAEATEPATEDQPYVILVNALVGHPVYEQQAEAVHRAGPERLVPPVPPRPKVRLVVSDLLAHVPAIRPTARHRLGAAINFEEEQQRLRMLAVFEDKHAVRRETHRGAVGAVRLDLFGQIDPRILA